MKKKHCSIKLIFLSISSLIISCSTIPDKLVTPSTVTGIDRTLASSSSCTRTVDEFFCNGDIVFSNDVYRGGVVKGVNPYQGTVTFLAENGHLYTSEKTSLALGSGCLEGYCVGDKVSDGYKVRPIAGVNPYSREIVPLDNRGYIGSWKIEETALGFGCVAGICVNDKVTSEYHRGIVLAVNKLSLSVVFGDNGYIYSLPVEQVALEETKNKFNIVERNGMKFDSSAYLTDTFHFSEKRPAVVSDSPDSIKVKERIAKAKIKEEEIIAEEKRKKEEDEAKLKQKRATFQREVKEGVARAARYKTEIAKVSGNPEKVKKINAKYLKIAGRECLLTDTDDEFCNQNPVSCDRRGTLPAYCDEESETTVSEMGMNNDSGNEGNEETPSSDYACAAANTNARACQRLAFCEWEQGSAGSCIARPGGTSYACAAANTNPKSCNQIASCEWRQGAIGSCHARRAQSGNSNSSPSRTSGNSSSSYACAAVNNNEQACQRLAFCNWKQGSAGSCVARPGGTSYACAASNTNPKACSRLSFCEWKQGDAGSCEAR